MKQHVNRYLRGFTLIELLVVLVILGLLAGLVGPQVIKYLGGANTKTAKLQIEDFSTALDAFRLDMGRYPTTNEGLQTLVIQPSGANRCGKIQFPKTRGAMIISIALPDSTVHSICIRWVRMALRAATVRIRM